MLLSLADDTVLVVRYGIHRGWIIGGGVGWERMVGESWGRDAGVGVEVVGVESCLCSLGMRWWKKWSGRMGGGDRDGSGNLGLGNDGYR